MHRERWVCLSRDDCQPSTVQPSLPQEGTTQIYCWEIMKLPYRYTQEESCFLSWQLNSTFPNFQVLIIGGGDGGVLREVVKNPLVESVVLCEIDEVRATTPTRILASLQRAILIIDFPCLLPAQCWCSLLCRMSLMYQRSSSQGWPKGFSVPSSPSMLEMGLNSWSRTRMPLTSL